MPDGPAFQFAYVHEWIPSVGVKYHVGVDGISILLILLTTLLGFISVYSSFSAITHREKEYYVFLLLLQTGMLGVFMSLDFVLFYVFWEVMLVPMYFLIGVWGGPRKLYAAIKFFLYTLVGSVLMLVGILALYFYNSTGLAAIGLPGLGNAPTFDVTELFKIAPFISRPTSSSGCSWRSSSASRSRCRCSRSTPGCRTPTSRRRRRAR